MQFYIAAAILAQQLRHVPVALGHRIVQRRRAIVDLGIDIGLVGQQQFRHVFVAIKRRQVNGDSPWPPWR